MRMHSLPVIKRACIEALGTMQTDARWREAYCALVDPTSVLVMAEALEKQDAVERTVSGADLLEVGQLVRDLTGYIKRMPEHGADAARSELLLQARQFLARSGL